MGIFLGLWALYYALQWLLLLRQQRAITANGTQIPVGFEDVVAADDQAKATAYGLAKLKLARVELLLEAALLAWWIPLGGIASVQHALAATLPALSSSAPSVFLSPDFALVVVVLAVGAVVEWPLAAYRTFGVEARFGFNQSTWGLFLKDQLLGLALSAVLGLPLLGFVLFAMSSLGTHWWWVAYAVFVAFSLGITVLYPTVIAPLFNQFKPLDDEALKTTIDALLAEVGFESKGVFVMDGSRRSTHGNAYFTGFGRHKRIVFFDTLLERLTPAEIRAVLAHELGHFKLNHIKSQWVLRVFTLGVGFWVLGQLSLQVWVFQGLGLTISPGVVLLTCVLALHLISWPIQPLQNAFSRRHEYQADAFAVEYSSSDHLASALKKLVRDNASCLVPDRWYARFFASHPSVVERVHALNS